MKVTGIIPARLASSRFPGKPLVEIEGLPMVIHVMKRAMLCDYLDEVCVATDSRKIFSTVEKYGGRAIMTSSKHKTGTDRIAEAASKIGTSEIVVNIQGDEPLVNPDDISKLVKAVSRDASCKFATLICKTPSRNDDTECKVVLDLNDNILYMSRSDIPSPARVKISHLYKLYCVVAFRKPFLQKFAGWPLTPLEKIEYIEYIRILERGYKMKGVIVDEYSTSVDTPRDLIRVKKMMKLDKIKNRYLSAFAQKATALKSGMNANKQRFGGMSPSTLKADLADAKRGKRRRVL
ncbi:MAG: 3-deoxy-manno-octulosonate cytidylyltransferase [Candidatus Omnitrophica bacterium]|nr:3-deoxy-manno-octulosonate cytidylyltransferase [Candidatus Omnitrophota bacterium]